MFKRASPKALSAAPEKSETAKIDLRYFARAGLLVIVAIFLIIILAGLSDSELWSSNVWRGPGSGLIIGALMALAFLQQAIFSAASIKAIPGLRRADAFAIALPIIVTTSLVNTVAPAKAGTLLRSILFRDRLGVSCEVFFGSQSALATISLFAATPAIALVVFYMADLLITGGLIIGLLLMVIVIRFAMQSTQSRTAEKSGLRQRLQLFFMSLRDPFFNQHARAWMVGLGVVNFLVIASRSGLSLALVGANYSPMAAFAVAAALVVAPFFAFLPGGIGTREFLFGAAALGAGVPIEMALAAALVDRAIGTLALTFMAIPSAWQLNRTEASLTSDRND